MPIEKVYIGVKLIRAYQLTKGESEKILGRQIGGDYNLESEGYHVTYPDGYQSWSPKGVFEEAYRELSKNDIAIMR